MRQSHAGRCGRIPLVLFALAITLVIASNALSGEPFRFGLDLK